MRSRSSRALARAWALLLATALGLGLDPATAAPPAAPRGRGPGQVVRVEHRDPDTVPSRGPASAPVTVELYFLPTTNAQARLPSYRMIEKLQASHPARIRVIYRVVKRSGQVQLPAAALEAHAQGKFFDFMEELHRDRTITSLDRAKILDLARRIGMDVPRVAAAMSSDRYLAVLEANDHRLDRITRGRPSVPAVLFNTRPPRSSLGSMGDADYEREYAEAYERAMELVDRGVDPRSLMNAFDALVLRSTQPFVGSTGPTDDDIDGEAFEHKLASPPLSLAGLPSLGRPDARAAVPVVILCRPNDSQCGHSVNQLRKLQRIYPDEVRLVWAPWFDVSREDAAALTLLGDAVLCAEQVGSSPDDLNASPGWRWIEKQLSRANRSHRRRTPPEKLIDDITAETGIDSQKLSACRARMASATLEWIERARRSGVTRAPALVVGGRIYEGIPDHNVVQQLVEAELAPGVLGELAPAWPRARR
jgi:predicted DsbA family dithiol-disulfide isomerase